jgi:hypothetical protein
MNGNKQIGQSMNEQLGAQPACPGGWAQRATLALVSSLALLGGPGCGDSPAAVVDADRISAYATVKVPHEAPASWTLPAEGVRFIGDGERSGLVIAAGEEELSIALPVPPEARGAGRVTLRVLSDGAFGLRIVLGEHESKIVRSNDTRRLYKELQFPLTAPLADGALATPMRIVRASSEQPVLIELIRFLP